MTAHTEIELKLEVAPGAAPLLGQLPKLAGAQPRVQQQRTTYFDTADQALRAAGLSLRIRKAGGRRVQTIKTEAAAGGLLARTEWEHEVARDQPEINPAQDTPLAAFDPATLARTFVARVTRTRWELGHGEARLELLLDEGAIHARGRKAVVSEVELELLAGSPAAIFSLAHAVGAHIPVRLGVLTKSERGLRLLDGRLTKPAKAEPLALMPEMSAAAALQAIARGCIRQYRLNEDLLLATGAAAPLHQARVALRRLRSALSLFRPLLRDTLSMQLRIELRELAGALGEVRNIDVLVPRLTDPAVARPLADARVRAFGEVRERLEEPAARGLMLRLAEWLAIGEWLNAPETAVTREQPIDAFAADLLQRTRRRLKRRGRRLASVDDEARHEARIVAKKLRYAAEFFAETFPAPKARRRRAAFLEALEALQEALGDLNDQAAGRAVLAEIGISEDVARASLGRAIDRDVLLARAEASYDRLMAIKRFWI